MGLPERAEQIESGGGNGDDAVLCSLAVADDDLAPLGIDVAGREPLRFTQSQAARVAELKEGAELRFVRVFDEGTHLSTGEDDRQHAGPLYPQDAQRVPVAGAGDGVEELQAGDDRLQCAGGEFFLSTRNTSQARTWSSVS